MKYKNTGVSFSIEKKNGKNFDLFIKKKKQAEELAIKIALAFSAGKIGDKNNNFSKTLNKYIN